MTRAAPVRQRGLAAATVAVIAALAVVAAVAPAAAQTVPDPETTLRQDVAGEELTDDVQDPTALEVAADGRVVIAERTGRVKIWHQDGTLTTAGRIGVDSKAGQCDDCPGDMLDEGGLHGLLLAPDFADTGHLYLYYSVPESMGEAPVPAKHPDARGPQAVEGKFRLSRFTLHDDTLDVGSEMALFENPAEWLHCCHYGGDMEWLPDGTLLLSVGDDTISSMSDGYSPRDNRSGFEYNNADLTSQNLADRRGKLLRIDVRDVDGDGSLLPPDNPYVDDPDADPFVYALGFRSNYRFAVDAETGRSFVGTVGPDGKVPDPNRGPAAQEDLEEVPAGGGTNHGWPRCIADNIAYNHYDWETNQAGGKLSCEGMTPASIWYSYQPDPTTSPYVQLGSGGTCSSIIGGAVYHRPDAGALALPERFDDHLLWLEWCRGVVVSTPISADGSLDTDVEDVKIIHQGLSSPIDATVGPDGALYIAEYASRNYQSGNSRISRVICAGCEPDPSDYDGAAVVDPGPARLHASVVPTTSPGGGHGGLALVVIAAGVLAYGLRRRRAVV